MSETSHITPEGYQRFSDELDALWRVERPRVVQEVADAAAMGDRSENAEYIYGKRRLREIDRRMRYLSTLLDRVSVVDPSLIKSEKVQFGATVTMADENERTRSFQLIGVDEVDVKLGRISVASPMGKALLGKNVGDVVVVKRPAGDLEVEITAIKYV
jgi:transcription elongation factor GreB